MRRLSLLLAILCLLLLAPHVQGATRRYASETTLTVLEPGAPDTLNPLLDRTTAAADELAPVFDSLVRLDRAGVPQPDLATLWRRSVNDRTWTFTLNPQARWQDGEPVTADDVAFTIGLVRDARFGAASTLGFDRIKRVTISGRFAITIALSASYAPFLALVGTTPILPAHVLRDIPPGQIRGYAPFNHHPIGSGPFAVAEWTADGHVVEEANPDYFGGAPHLTRLVFAPTGTHHAALAAASRDSMALTPPSLGLSPADVAKPLPAGSPRAVYSDTFAWTHLDLIEHGALATQAIRRALALATPRDRIIARVLHGRGRIGDGDQAPGTPAYDASLHNSYHFNPRAARRLLQQAGYSTLKSGLMGQHDTPLDITLWGDASCATCADTLRLIAQGWRSAGVASHIRLVSTALLFGPKGPLYDPGRFHASRYDAVLYTWVNGPDPDDSAYWTRGAIVTPAHPLGGNFDGYANAAVDALIVRAVITPNGPGRYALYRRVQRFLVADEPDIFLYWSDAISLVPRTLHGYAPNPYAPAATWNANTWSVTAGP